MAAQLETFNRLMKGTFNQEEEETELDKVSIKYAKEFFVNEKGEVIKMAAIVTNDPVILSQLKEDQALLWEINVYTEKYKLEKDQKVGKRQKEQTLRTLKSLKTLAGVKITATSKQKN